MKTLLGWVLGHLLSLLGKSKKLWSCLLRGWRCSTERAVMGSGPSAHTALISTSAESPTKLQMRGQSAGVPAIKEQTCQCPSSTLDISLEAVGARTWDASMQSRVAVLFMDHRCHNATAVLLCSVHVSYTRTHTAQVINYY